MQMRSLFSRSCLIGIHRQVLAGIFIDAWPTTVRLDAHNNAIRDHIRMQSVLLISGQSGVSHLHAAACRIIECVALRCVAWACDDSMRFNTPDDSSTPAERHARRVRSVGSAGGHRIHPFPCTVWVYYYAVHVQLEGDVAWRPDDACTGYLYGWIAYNVGKCYPFL